MDPTNRVSYPQPRWVKDRIAGEFMFRVQGRRFPRYPRRRGRRGASSRVGRGSQQPNGTGHFTEPRGRPHAGNATGNGGLGVSIYRVTP